MIIRAKWYKYNIVTMIRSLILLVILFLACPAFPSSALEGLVKFTSANNLVIFLEIAVTDEEKQEGLMNRTNLPENRGMVFVFRPEKPVTFWMKDTLIPLDMIFINRGKIVKIVKNAIPNRSDILYPSDVAVTEVIEVNGGFADKNMIEAGNEIVFENIGAIDYSKQSKLIIIKRR